MLKKQQPFTDRYFLRTFFECAKWLRGPTLYTQNPEITGGSLMEVAEALGMRALAEELHLDGVPNADLIGYEVLHEFSAQVIMPPNHLPVQYRFKASAILHQDAASATFTVSRSGKSSEFTLKIVVRENPETKLFQVDKATLDICIGAKQCAMTSDISCEAGNAARLEELTAIMNNLAPHILSKNLVSISPVSTEIGGMMSREINGGHMRHATPLRRFPNLNPFSRS